MATQQITVPDVGGSQVDVIDILVKPGQQINIDDPLVTLESDKATMDVPATAAGVVKEIKVKKGDKVAEGSVILVLESSVAEDIPEQPTGSSQAAPTTTAKAESSKPTNSNAGQLKTITVPDVGGSKVDVIEINVQVGDTIKVDDPLITLESDKATMDVPATVAGVVKEIKVKKGDKVEQGSVIVVLESIADDTNNVGQIPEDSAKAESSKPTAASANMNGSSANVSLPVSQSTPDSYDQQIAVKNAAPNIYAGPGTRRLAQELGVDLNKVKGTGRKERILPEDVQAYVKSIMRDGGGTSGAGLNLLPWPSVDFNKFGATELKLLNKIKRLTAQNLHRNWVMIPHVTQFDEADITDMEEFRKASKEEAEKKGYKLTPIVFIIKAVVAALKAYPQFNASLDSSGENLIMKKYFNIGVAVDTPNGLVVPVLRDADKKGVYELAKELADISKKAREKGLSPQDMQGGNFSISSLGGIGGTAFTPIVNAPDVAILGISKSQMKQVYINGEFVPRLMLPLSLSYDHRVIDGADGARFISYLSSCLGDLRKLLL